MSKLAQKQNKSKALSSLILGLFWFSFLPACDEIETYSEIPQIEYIETTIIDSTDALGNPKTFVKLLFTAIDGDGDMGLNDFDTINPFTGMYEYNFFSTLFFVDSAGYDSAPVPAYNFRIPYIEFENHKAYKADITVEFQYFRDFLATDSIAYEFFIVDRTLNHSDTVLTPAISLNQTSTP